MPSTALPGRLNEDVECDLMFYKEERNLFHIIDRCIRSATGMEMPDKTMSSILDACHQFWIQFGPARVLYSDREGALHNAMAKTVLTAKGAELRIRARGQRDATIETRNDIVPSTSCHGS
eukprot:56659-Pyramimonas_sp.AAC.1